ncbi:MAG: glycosyltransferase family 39 protein [Aggregatilineales bacterium]
MAEYFPKRRTNWLLLVGLIILAAALRVYHLDASSLRGDEAFTIRYWAAPIGQVLALAGHEPHPLGALLGFGVWKALVGDSEFAMRALPALVNLIGVPALYGLGKRLFRDPQIGYVAAALWTANPSQLWHAQDARDYAVWAALSALAVWLLVCACDRRRRIDWALYGIAAIAALYMYFTEIGFVVVGALYVFGWQRNSSVRRGFLVTWIGIGVLLIPWLIQAWALAHSNYGGTASAAYLPDLWTQFLPALIIGNVLPALAELWPTLALLLIWCVWALFRRGQGRTALFLGLYVVTPGLLLALAATRAAVWRVDYLLAAATPLLLLLAYGAVSLHRRIAFRVSAIAWMMSGALAVIFVGLPLIAYWGSRKAADWRGLQAYLVAHVHSDDLVLLTTLDPTSGGADPAFDYYYRDRTDFATLPRDGVDSAAYLQTAAARYRAIWFVPSGPYAADLDKILRTNLQLISDEGAGQSFLVREYRAPIFKPEEIEQPRTIHSESDGFTLRGFSLEQSAAHLTVLLFWQPGSTTRDTVFVHLLGRINPATGTPLWTQDDHPPTLPGTAPRDVYSLDLSRVPPGTYQLEIGLYDPASGQRRTLTDGSGQALGDSGPLTKVSIP